MIEMRTIKKIPFLIMLAVIMLCMCACSNSESAGSDDAEPAASDAEINTTPYGAPADLCNRAGDLTFVPDKWGEDSDIYTAHYGAFDADGNQVLPYEYGWDYKYIGEDRYIVDNVVHNTGTILIDGKGNEIVPSGYTLDALGASDEDGDSPVKNPVTAKRNSDGKCGFMDPADGSIFIEPQYLDASIFYEGFAAVQDENGMWGTINEDAKYVIPPEYDMEESLVVAEDQGIAATDKNGQHVFVVKDNGEVRIMRPEVPVRSTSEFPELEFDDGLAVVMEYKEDDDWNDPTGKYGVIDKHGKIVVPLEYDDPGPLWAHSYPVKDTEQN